MKKLIIVIILSLVCLAVLASTHVPDTRYTADEFWYRDWRFAGAQGEVCFGLTGCGSQWTVGVGYIDYMMFQCVTGGTASKIRLLTSGVGTGQVRMAIYSHNATYIRPNLLLWEGTDQSYTTGWIEEAVTGLTIVAGTYYWLAFKDNSSGAECYTGGAGTHFWSSLLPYSDPFPANFATVGGQYNNNQYSMQLCTEAGVSETYSGRGIGRGISRGVMR